MSRRGVLLAGVATGLTVTGSALFAGYGVVGAFGIALAVSCGVALFGDGARSARDRAGAVAHAPETHPPEPEVREHAHGPAQAVSAAEAVRSLMDAAHAAGSPVAAHLWLEDGPGGTLRLVAATGPVAPSREPVSTSDEVLSGALGAGCGVLEPVSDVHTSDTENVLWRYALPVLAGGSRGVVAVDLVGAEAPDADALDDIAAAHSTVLAGALALDVARVETETARTLVEMARDLSAILSVEGVVEACLDKAMRLADAATGSVMLLDDDGRVMRIAAARGLPSEVSGSASVSAGEGIAGWVLMSGQPVLVEDLPSRPNQRRRHGVRSAMSVPLADEHGSLGVLNVGSRAFPARFTSSHMSALETLGRQCAVAVRNARALSATRELYFSTLRALALALETKDPYASGATDRIVAYTTAMSDAMAVPEREAEAIRLSALLHDICMDATSEIAARRRQLSTVERGMLTMHPVLAAEVLQEAPALRAAVPIVYHHHEWFDGRGYVGGLAGADIPLGARILAVADAYVAMTSDRPYRRALSREEAMREMEAKAGTQFDPEVVRVFVGLVRSGRERADVGREGIAGG